MPRRIKSKNHSGFTLVEMLVAATVFVTSTLVLVQVYSVTQKNQERVAGESLVISEARYALEAIVREMRTGSINYSYYGAPVTGIVNTLALRDSSGNSLLFKKGAKGDGSCSLVSNCILYSINSSVWSKLTKDDTNISRLDFYIFPSTFDVASTVQPRVTIVLTLENLAARPGEQKVITVQTTAASRIYLR